MPRRRHMAPIKHLQSWKPAGCQSESHNNIDGITIQTGTGKAIIALNTLNVKDFLSILFQSLMCRHVSVQRFSPSISHQSARFQVSASFPVELSPMTVFASRGQPLGQPAIGKPLVCRVYPSEAECLLDDFEIWKTILTRSLRPVASHPAALLRKVIHLEPFPQLTSFCEGQQIGYFHTFPYFGCKVTSYNSNNKIKNQKVRNVTAINTPSDISKLLT